MAASFVAESNVYYLPAVSTPPAPRPAPVRFRGFTRVWWRLRFALAGLRLALRPSRTPLFAEDEALAALEGQVEVIERRPRRSRPARVIDFGAARARLRPLATN